MGAGSIFFLLTIFKMCFRLVNGTLPVFFSVILNFLMTFKNSVPYFSQRFAIFPYNKHTPGRSWLFRFENRPQ